jgi:CheY-like chemotaxis protein
MKAILIVDDEFDARRTLELLFEMEGYETMSAQNGEVALAKIAESTPDIILTDWMMPLMDGYQFCRRVRANPATKSIPIILLTAAVSAALPKEKLWDVLVAKPAYFEQLLELVNELTSDRE